MAAAMMCPAHGPVTGQACIPGCFEALQPYVATPVGPAATCPAPGCGMPLPCPLHAGSPPDAVQREVTAYRAASGAPSGAAALSGQTAVGGVLEFPWGAVAIPPAGLTIGRDFGAECGPQIDTYDNVSRAHARISLEDGQLFVEDVHSTNGTTVNGVVTVPGRPHALGDGDVLGFGNRLRASVRIRMAQA